MKVARQLNQTESEMMTLFEATRLFLLVVLTVQFSLTTVPAQQTPSSGREVSDRLVEEFGFIVKDFKNEHQGGKNFTFTITVRFRSNLKPDEYPDYMVLAKDVSDFMDHYPNETDYWEVVNKKFTLMFLNKHLTIVAVTSRIDLAPTPSSPYVRWCTTTRERLSSGRTRTSVR